MRTKTKIMLLLSTFALMTWGSLALAADSNNPLPPMHGPGGPGGADGIIGVIMHRLDLTDEQRDKIKTILDSSRDKMQAARQAIGNAHKKLNDAVMADANETTIRSAATALGTVIGDEAVLKAAEMKEIKSVLTAEQKTKLEEITAGMKDRGPRGFRQHRGGPMPPPPENE